MNLSTLLSSSKAPNSGKDYHFYINGQTGQIHPSLPISFWRMLFLVLVVTMMSTASIFFA